MSWLPLPRFESPAVCVAVPYRERGARMTHPISVESRRGGLLVRPWMGASFGCASADSLDMPWLLPLPRFESPAGVCVAVPYRERGARMTHPISVETRRRGSLVRPLMGASFGCASADSRDMSWLLPLPRFESPAGVCVAVCGLGVRGEGAKPNIR
jgi:hypothetical protein